MLPKVAILLSTYHGQHYLAEQLDSFSAQTHSDWEVWASDDGSADGTPGILAAYRQQWPAGRLAVCAGPAQGFAANFLALTCNDRIQADYYAYSDQDDIWHPDKLERAVQWLQGVPAGTPALYCSRTMLVDAANRDIGLSPWFGKPCFANALVQNIAGGNTMVFNQAARTLLRAAAQVPIVYHDWWAYMAVTGCGGQVFCDPVPTLRYRQHGGNLVGVDVSWQARWQRLLKVWQGQHREWNSAYMAALRKLEDRLTPESRAIFQRFAQAREMSLVPRLVNVCRSGVYRQTRLGNISLAVAAIFRKI
ncbi:glycosyltransferase family 2 protein [Pseudoduganella sp. HUAS MS19]